MDYPKAYIYESKYFMPLVATIVVAVIILLTICFVPHMQVADKRVSIHDAIKSNKFSISAARIFICIPQKLQLENLGLGMLDTRYFNIPINPTLIESTIDGFMAQKTIVDGKTIYKISLPLEVQLSELNLDATLSSTESAFVFVENQDGDRVWEKNVKLLPGRYHTIQISSIAII